MTVGATTWTAPLGSSPAAAASRYRRRQTMGGNAISFTGPTTLSAGITSTDAAVTFNSAVTLGASDSIATSGGPVDFASTVNDGTSNTHSLTVNAGSGTVTFGSTVGSTGLASLTVTGPTTLDGSVTTGSGQTYNSAVTLGADSTMTAGSGTMTFGSTVGGDHNLTATAPTFSFGGAWGGTPLADVSLTSTNGLTLPSITAASIFAQTTGASSDITLSSGTKLTASGSGTAITLASGRNFIDSEGSDALSASNGQWLIYSTNPSDNTLDGLSASFDRYTCAYGGSCPDFSGETGNGLLYSYTPTLTVTPSGSTATYGSAANLSGYAYSVSGYLSGELSTDSVTGSLNGSTAYVSGDSVGTYNVNYSSGSLASALGYGFTYANNATALTVNPASLIVTAANKSMDVGGSVPPLTYSYTGLVNGDASASFSGASPPAARAAAPPAAFPSPSARWP